MADLLEVPADLREEILACAKVHQIDLDWLIGLYRRGFAAKMGPTGNFPYGKMGQDDEGELTVAIATDVQHGVIKMVFGKHVSWVALPASHARALAALLLKKADELEKRLS